MYNKVKNQFNHAIKIEDKIARFNLLWISFNCYYNIKLWKHKSDRDKVNELKCDEFLKKLFLTLDNKKFHDFICSRFWGRWWVKNLLKDKYVVYLCKDCFPEYLEIIYTIRNNQFHWWKDPEQESDNELIWESIISFEDFLWKLYKEEKIIK